MEWSLAGKEIFGLLKREREGNCEYIETRKVARTSNDCSMMNGGHSTPPTIDFKLEDLFRESLTTGMAHPYLSIVIPAYNESARIENALERVMSCVAERGCDAEVPAAHDGPKATPPPI